MSMIEAKTSAAPPPFILFCFGGFFLAIAYGVTFLIPLLVNIQGGDEIDAGLVISIATISTVLFVILSGHIADLLGSARSLAISGVLLSVSSLGFAFSETLGTSLMLFGLILGIGWGVFYTIGPILIAAIIAPEKRIQYFAFLSGAMMLGIGTGPLLGRLVSLMEYRIESAFIIAAITSLIGSTIFFYIHLRLHRNDNIAPQTSRITFAKAIKVARSDAIFPIIMVGLGGCIFGGLSSFQTSYAVFYGFDYSLFFIGFVLAVITCRLLIAGYIAKIDSYKSAFVLTGFIVIALLLFIFLTHVQNPVLYTIAAIILGIGYGLTYSVINGLAANTAPNGLIPQSLLLFSLSYFIGVFGFPLIAGQLIVKYSLPAMLYSLLLLSLLNNGITIYRLLVARRLSQR